MPEQQAPRSCRRSSPRLFRSAETRLFLLLKLRLDTLDVAQALGISKDNVYRSRHQLSKKLGLPETGNLDVFVREFM